MKHVPVNRGLHNCPLNRAMNTTSAATDPCVVGSLCHQQEQFAQDGFVVLDRLIDPEVCSELNQRIEKVLRGEYNKDGGAPDKSPKFSADTRSKSGKAPPPLGGPSKRTLQIINIWKADESFAKVVCSEALGRAVAELAGWEASLSLLHLPSPGTQIRTILLITPNNRTLS